MTGGATHSVVIPTRDRTSALAQTLDALEAQADAEVEVIVVVNGSVAASRELVCAPLLSNEVTSSVTAIR